MKFAIKKWSNAYALILVCNGGSGYFLQQKNFDSYEVLEVDEIIMCVENYIPLTEQQYRQILTQHNAKAFFNHTYYFKELEDVQKALEYIENTYGTLLALIE